VTIYIVTDDWVVFGNTKTITKHTRLLVQDRNKHTIHTVTNIQRWQKPIRWLKFMKEAYDDESWSRKRVNDKFNRYLPSFIAGKDLLPDD